MTLLKNLRQRHPRAAQTPPPRREPAQSAPPPAAPDSPPEPQRARQRAPRPANSLQGPILTPVLTNSDQTPEKVREGGANAVHVHGLLNDCPRKLQLAKRSVIPLYQGRPTGGHRVMWAIGKAVEHHIRSSYISEVEGVNVLGMWECPCAETRLRADVRPNDPCPNCNMRPWVYKELVLYNPDYGVRGSPDMVLRQPQGHVVVEIKSMKADGADGFDALDEPLAKHIEQAAIYRRLLQLEGVDVADFVVIIYCTKDFRYGNPYKEFMVPIMAGSLWENAVTHHLEQASLILSPQLRPRLPQCTAPHKPAAKSCPTCVDCFSRAD